MTTKKQQAAEENQQAIESVRNWIESRLPVVNDKIEIHANRIKHSDNSQEFSLFAITTNHSVANLDFEVHHLLGTRLTKDQRRLTRRGGNTDLAHDTVRDLERVLGYEPYTFRYVEHLL